MIAFVTSVPSINDVQVNRFAKGPLSFMRTDDTTDKIVCVTFTLRSSPFQPLPYQSHISAAFFYLHYVSVPSHCPNSVCETTLELSMEINIWKLESWSLLLVCMSKDLVRHQNNRWSECK